MGGKRQCAKADGTHLQTRRTQGRSGCVGPSRATRASTGTARFSYTKSGLTSASRTSGQRLPHATTAAAPSTRHVQRPDHGDMRPAQRIQRRARVRSTLSAAVREDRDAVTGRPGAGWPGVGRTKARWPGARWPRVRSVGRWRWEGCDASVWATASSSSVLRTSTTPAWARPARRRSYGPATAPVCERAACAPVPVRPDLITTTGLRRVTRAAANRRTRASLHPSMCATTTLVSSCPPR